MIEEVWWDQNANNTSEMYPIETSMIMQGPCYRGLDCEFDTAGGMGYTR
jgi:hypothetical protein